MQASAYSAQRNDTNLVDYGGVFRAVRVRTFEQ